MSDMDKGPWRVRCTLHHGWVVESDDFERDVTLSIHGDFATDADRRAYCEWLAAKLNGEGK